MDEAAFLFKLIFPADIDFKPLRLGIQECSKFRFSMNSKNWVCFYHRNYKFHIYPKYFGIPKLEKVKNWRFSPCIYYFGLLNMDLAKIHRVVIAMFSPCG